MILTVPLAVPLATGPAHTCTRTHTEQCALAYGVLLPKRSQEAVHMSV